MAEKEVLALYEDDPSSGVATGKAAQSGDTYGMPRDVSMNNNDINDVSRVFVGRPGGEITSTASAGEDPWVDVTNDTTYDYTGGIVIPPAVAFMGTHTLKDDANIAAMGFLYRSAATIKNDSAESVTDFGSFYTLDINPTFEADTDTIDFGLLNFQYDISVAGTMTTSNSGTLSCGTWAAMNVGGSIQSGATVTTKCALRAADPTVNGTLTNNCGVIIDDLGNGTNNVHLLYGTTTAPSGDYGIYQGNTDPNRFNGANEQPITSSTAATVTLNGTHHTLKAARTSNQTVNLPAASGCTGRIYNIVKTASGGTLTVDGNGSETINGATTWTSGTQWAGITIQSDGSNWIKIGITS